MKLNTIIKLHDGRIGTICWSHLDGFGGVFGEHLFEIPDNSFSDSLPAPEFMLREKSVEKILRQSGHRSDLECVGTHYEIMAKQEEAGE